MCCMCCLNSYVLFFFADIGANLTGGCFVRAKRLVEVVCSREMCGLVDTRCILESTCTSAIGQHWCIVYVCGCWWLAVPTRGHSVCYEGVVYGGEYTRAVCPNSCFFCLPNKSSPLRHTISPLYVLCMVSIQVCLPTRNTICLNSYECYDWCPVLLFSVARLNLMVVSLINSC